MSMYWHIELFVNDYADATEWEVDMYDFGKLWFRLDPM